MAFCDALFLARRCPLNDYSGSFLALHAEMEEKDDVPQRPQPKGLQSSDVASIFDLQNELIKRKNEVAARETASGTGDYARVGKPGGVLAVNKNERDRLKGEAYERKRKIEEYARAMKAEDEQLRAKQRKIMQEKTELYEKLHAGEVVLTHKDETPVEFMVDFHMKMKELDDKADKRFSSFDDYAEAGPSVKRDVQPERFNPDEEQRVYGASHLRLSQDEEKRKEQIKKLYELSDQTDKLRDKRAEEKRKREEANKAKLARLRKRFNLPDEDEPAPEPEYLDIPLPAVETVEEKFSKRIKNDREWDRGKGSYNTWIEKERSERDDEFAPPQMAPHEATPPWRKSPTPRLSWAQLLAHCKACRGEVRSSVGVPFSRLSIAAKPNGDCIVYALGTPSSSSQQTVLSVDINHSVGSTAQFRPLLVSEQFRNSTSAEFSLLCERQRVSTVSGISDFSIHRDHSVLLTTGAEVYRYEPNVPRLSCVWRDANGSSFVSDAQPCPSDSDLVAFVAERQVHVERGGRLIFSTESPKNTILNGVPSFVTQVKLDRFTGIWWAPTGSRLLYEQVDEENVQVLSFDCPGKEPADPMRYPVTGSPNAKSSLRMLFIEGDKVQDIGLRTPLQERFPWIEYITRAGFLSDGKTVWVQVANRAQSRICLILLPEHEWGHTGVRSLDGIYCSTSVRLTSPLIIFDEFSETWINTHNLIEPLPLLDDRRISFIYATEASSDCHLCRLDSELRPNGQLQATVERRLTHGSWSVCKQAGLVVDRQREHVFFVANINNPLEMTLCVTGYSEKGPRAIERLTEQGWTYRNERVPSALAVVPGLGFTCWLTNLCNPPQCRFYILNYPHDGGLPTSCVLCQLELPGCTLSARFTSVDRPILFEYKSRNSGYVHYALLLRPPDSIHDRDGTRYPVVHHVYGGPGIQLVRSDWATWVQLLKYSYLGFCVVLADGRGSHNRGRDFEAPIKGSFGTVEVEDQLEALNEVALRSSCMDLTRVAVQGWSYGGYLSLVAIAKYPEVYRACVAGGAVTDWRLYDTAYTERYLGYPLVDSIFKNSSVIAMVDQLPDEPGRVLIVHGLLDENVHFRHSESLLEAMLRAGKPYQLQIFPSERHGIRSSESAAHLDATLINFVCNAFGT
ncbi:unnamed protein product, partial [Mesorhabditis belari]|uniref:Dipeptidyl peptidase 8 n=1 Tax=Mesorhabditis belari TaxID=2138241 RepID=A0AAF3J9L1_9BILA